MSYTPQSAEPFPSHPAFREIIADLRSRKSLTQEQLATELKVSFATVNRWETGKTVPDAATLHRLAEFAQ